MPNLIDELKADHKKLVEILEQVRKLGPSAKETLPLLRSAKAGLLAHLGEEDTQLYPFLKEAAKTDNSIKSTLEMFAKDMEKVSQAALDFFAKYEKGADGMEFAKDFGNLVAVLANRIRREEEKLYPLYDKVLGKKAA